MPFETTQVDDRTQELLLNIAESYTADLKAIEVAPIRLTKSLSSCNADGGELFIGPDEDKPTGARTWRGFADVEAANGHVQALEAFFPLSRDVDYEFLRCAGEPDAGLVLKVTLRRTPDVRKASDGRVYVRRGAQNLPLDDEGVRRLEYQKGTRSFETHPVDVPLEMVTNSETIIEFMLEIVPTGEPEGWLTKQLLIRDNKPTVASLVLFADEPQAALPKQSAVKVYRYATSNDTGSRANLVGQPMTVEGCAHQVIREAVVRGGSVRRARHAPRRRGRHLHADRGGQAHPAPRGRRLERPPREEARSARQGPGQAGEDPPAGRAGQGAGAPRTA